MKISRTFDMWSVCLDISGVPDTEGRKGGTGSIIRTFQPNMLTAIYYRNPHGDWMLWEVRVSGPWLTKGGKPSRGLVNTAEATFARSNLDRSWFYDTPDWVIAFASRYPNPGDLPEGIDTVTP